MKLMTREEVKRVELDILTNIAEFCERNNLTYCLTYGTLLGAIRHKGFIPWDDDVDIFMPRADYNEFLRRYNAENGNTRYTAISPYDKRSRHTFAKVIDEQTVKIEAETEYPYGNIGVDVDIFPLDGEADDDREHAAWFKKLHQLYSKNAYLILDKNKNIKRRALLPIIRLLLGSKKHLLKKAERLHKLYNYEESAYVGAIESQYESVRNRFKKELFDSFVLAPFENRQFKIPAEYDEILTHIYGDYMQPPPEDKRVTHHINNMYWREDET